MDSRPAYIRFGAWAAKQLLWACLGGRVASGPFQGLRYIRHSVGSAFGAKLLGTYELELRNVIQALPGINLRTVIDLGAAEGYYAIGLAKRLRCNVIAFESELSGRQALAELAGRNEVESLVEIRGRCEIADLLKVTSSDLTQASLVICDIEGAERQLLAPVSIPALSHNHILVEVHEQIEPGVQAELEARFRASHSICVIHSATRHPGDFPNICLGRLLPDSLKIRMMEEHRGGVMSWLWMVPFSNGKG